jgi:hypothetical protein
MKTNTITNGTATSWSASTPAREQFGIAPYGPRHGTAVPSAQPAAATFAGTAAMTHTARLAVLTDAGKGSDPRERKR